MRPEQSEFERQDGAGDRTYRKHDRGTGGPAPREQHINVVAGAAIEPPGHHHQQRHRDPDAGKDDVEGERHRHLGSRGENIRHHWSVGR